MTFLNAIKGTFHPNHINPNDQFNAGKFIGKVFIEKSEIFKCYMYVLQRNLSGFLIALHKYNETSAFRKCVQTIMLYTSNILKDSSNPKTNSINLDNKNFQKYVLSLKGGLIFLLCSPVFWKICYSKHCLVVNDYFLEIGSSNSEFRSQWHEAMTNYCMFLSSVLALLRFQ